MFQQVLGIWQDGPRAPHLPRNTAVQVSVAQGLDARIRACLVDSLGTPVVLGVGDKLTLRVRIGTSSDVLFEVDGTAVADVDGAYDCAITGAMTADFQGYLIYDVIVTLTGMTQQVVATSYFNILPVGVG